MYGVCTPCTKYVFVCTHAMYRSQCNVPVCLTGGATTTTVGPELCPRGGVSPAMGVSCRKAVNRPPVVQRQCCGESFYPLIRAIRAPWPVFKLWIVFVAAWMQWPFFDLHTPIAWPQSGWEYTQEGREDKALQNSGHPRSKVQPCCVADGPRMPCILSQAITRLRAVLCSLSLVLKRHVAPASPHGPSLDSSFRVHVPGIESLPRISSYRVTSHPLPLAGLESRCQW